MCFFTLRAWACGGRDTDLYDPTDEHIIALMVDAMSQHDFVHHGDEDLILWRINRQMAQMFQTYFNTTAQTNATERTTFLALSTYKRVLKVHVTKGL